LSGVPVRGVLEANRGLVKRKTSRNTGIGVYRKEGAKGSGRGAAVANILFFYLI
jgi:hypothetical protein